MAKKVVKRRVKEDNSGLFIPAGLFIGLGFGSLSGNWSSGVLFGLGAGFALMALVRIFGR